MSALTIIIGILVIVAGFFITWKAFAIFQFIGRNDWAEEKLRGFGGTLGMIQFIGVAMIIVSFLYMSGACNSVLKGAGRYFGGGAGEIEER